MSKKDNKKRFGSFTFTWKGIYISPESADLKHQGSFILLFTIKCSSRKKKSTGLYGNTVLTINNYSHEKVEN